MSEEAGLPQKLHLLLVDDDSVDRMAVRRALGASGLPIQLTEVAHALEGLTAVRSGSFDCLLLDLQMPGHDGEWLLRSIRAEGNPVPIVMLTGQGDEMTAVRLLKAGASDYVAKSALQAGRIEKTVQNAVRVFRAEREAARTLRLLAESQQRLQLALDASCQGTWDFNVLTGELALDQRCRALFGFASDEPVSVEAVQSRMSPAEREEQRRRLAQAMSPSSGGVYTFEHSVQGAPTGTPRWVRVQGRCLFDGDQPTRLVGTALDVTEARQEAQNVQRRRLFEEQLLGIVSHDLRNPVSAMMMSASVLLRREGTPPHVAKSLERIVASGERATRMIRDLLDFTQARVGGGIPVRRQPMNVHELASQTVDEVRTSFAGRDVRLTCSGDGTGSWDADRLAQILTNLLVNAVTYSPSDTPVDVRLQGDAQGVRMEVHNRGAPIPAEKLAGLFEPFTRGGLEPAVSQRSIGLGLYIVRELTRAHGGTVDVSSSEASGTLFQIWLPKAAQLDAA